MSVAWVDGRAAPTRVGTAFEEVGARRWRRIQEITVMGLPRDFPLFVLLFSRFFYSSMFVLPFRLFSFFIFSILYSTSNFIRQPLTAERRKKISKQTNTTRKNVNLNQSRFCRPLTCASADSNAVFSAFFFSMFFLLLSSFTLFAAKSS